MFSIHPKVKAGFVAGTIGTLGGALLKTGALPHLTPAQLGGATTVLSLLAGYLTPSESSTIRDRVLRLEALANSTPANSTPAPAIAQLVAPEAQALAAKEHLTGLVAEGERIMSVLRGMLPKAPAAETITGAPAQPSLPSVASAPVLPTPVPPPPA